MSDDDDTKPRDILEEVLCADFRAMWETYTYPTDMEFMFGTDRSRWNQSLEQHWLTHGKPRLAAMLKRWRSADPDTK